MLKQICMVAAVAVVAGGCAAGPQPPPSWPPPPLEHPDRPAEPSRADPVRIGLVVSSSGSAVLQQYAELVAAGAQVAEAGSGTGRPIELVVRDDGGTAAGAAAAVQELERAGVRVIVGPLVDEALVAAARARMSDDVVIISPTAVSQPVGVRNAFALNVVDTRGAEALGEYARRWGRVGVLYSRLPESSRQAQAFIESYNRGGGIVSDAAFPAGATNLTDQLARLREANVEAVFFPASERELQVVLPQIEFAGLGPVQLLGNESWISDAARGAPRRVLEGAIVATPLLMDSDDVAWRDFERQYETMHRRSLANPVPALGYDATVLALRMLGTGRIDVSDMRAATGVLTLQAGHVTRRPFLVRIDGARLTPVH